MEELPQRPIILATLVVSALLAAAGAWRPHEARRKLPATGVEPAPHV